MKYLTKGSTASTTVFDGKGNLLTATLADAAAFAAVYDKEGKVLGVVRLNSITHKATWDVHPISGRTEVERLQALGGDVWAGRVNGLAVSRAIGDHALKSNNDQKLIASDAQIDITNVDTILEQLGIESSNVGKIQVITTCDGFTEGADNEKLDHATYLKNCLSGQPWGLRSEKDIAAHLVAAAKKSGSRDNLSVAVQTLTNRPVFLGVYDGHGGNTVARYIADNIGKRFEQQCDLSNEAYAAQELSADKSETYKSEHSAKVCVPQQSMDLEPLPPLTPNKQLLMAIDRAKTHYAQHYKNNQRHNRGHENGWFSWFRHGKEGQKNALALQIKCTDKSPAEIITNLDELLTHKDTRYNLHSFSSYLMDELLNMEMLRKMDGTSRVKEDRYTSQSWTDLREEIESYVSEIEPVPDQFDWS